jgi:hypothetical protein
MTEVTRFQVVPRPRPDEPSRGEVARLLGIVPTDELTVSAHLGGSCCRCPSVAPVRVPRSVRASAMEGVFRVSDEWAIDEEAPEATQAALGGLRRF